MAKTKFVYVTYIASTPEKVFQAITEPAVTRQYWGMENVSDWKPGSPWRYTDGKTVRILGEVIEHAPPRRLVISWAWPREADDRAKRTTAIKLQHEWHVLEQNPLNAATFD